MGTIDWNYWSNLADVTIDEAAMLSCGMNPFDLHPGETTDQRALCDTTHELPKRLAAARSHVNAKSLLTRYDRKRLCSVVTLRGFRQWSESLPVPFTFPDGFPRVEPEPAAPDAEADKPDKPLSVKRENTLLRVIVALAGAAKIDISEGKDGAATIASCVRVAKFDGPDERAIRNILKKAREL